MSEINPLKWASLPPAAQIKLQALQASLERYVTEMAPSKRMSEEKGMELQMSLWSAIKRALQLDGSEFIAHYSEILSTIQQHRRTGAFNEKYVYRYFESLPLPQRERRNFERMLNLMLTTCDPATRQLTLRQIDMRTALGGFEQEAIRQRVTAFYSL